MSLPQSTLFAEKDGPPKVDGGLGQRGDVVFCVTDVRVSVCSHRFGEVSAPRGVGTKSPNRQDTSWPRFHWSTRRIAGAVGLTYLCGGRRRADREATEGSRRLPTGARRRQRNADPMVFPGSRHFPPHTQPTHR